MFTKERKINFGYIPVTVMRYLRADAGADVEAQGLRPLAARLPQDDAVPEVAKDGRPAG